MILVTPQAKAEIVGKAGKDVITVEQQYRDGVITNGERYNKVIAIWSEATDKVAKEMFRRWSDREKARGDESDPGHGGFRRERLGAADSPARGHARTDGPAVG